MYHSFEQNLLKSIIGVNRLTNQIQQKIKKMNYILEVYSDGLFIPITGTAMIEKDDVVVLEFGIDDHFNNPEWMTQNVYMIKSEPYKNAGAPGSTGDLKVNAFLFDAQRDIMTHLDQTGFLSARA